MKRDCPNQKRQGGDNGNVVGDALFVTCDNGELFCQPCAPTEEEDVEQKRFWFDYENGGGGVENGHEKTCKADGKRGTFVFLERIKFRLPLFPSLVLASRVLCTLHETMQKPHQKKMRRRGSRPSRPLSDDMFDGLPDDGEEPYSSRFLFLASFCHLRSAFHTRL